VGRVGLVAGGGCVTDRLAEGRLHAIHVSNGGVPKHARASCRVTIDGIEGDRQRDLRFHGGPLRAVSLYSLELIDALQREGHPIVPGAIGENLTVAGLEWSAMLPGATIEIGPVRLVLTGFASPCKNIAPAFRDEHFVRVSQKVHPGWSRLYAKVEREGIISVGDPVRCIHQ
jgi:MOSC domain-containing protein YiiM